MILFLLTALALLLVLLEGFFSGSETVYTSVSKAFIHGEAEKGDRRALRIREMLSRTERFLGTTLTGTNLALVASTTLFQVIVARYVLGNPVVAAILQGSAAPWNWEYVINTFIMTPIIVVLAELVPKSVGRAHADVLALRLVNPIRVAETVLAPLAWAMSMISGSLAGLFGAGRQTVPAVAVTRDDLRAIAELAAEQGLVPEAAASMLQIVFELDRKPVSSMMIPLVDVASVPLEATLAEVESLSAETGYARFPVYRERVDEIVGIVSLRHLLYERDAAGQALPPEGPIAPHVRRDIMFIPESKPVGQLLEELRFQHVPMAVVVDEHGGVVGLLTLEDLLEEVVGEIQDERDRPLAEVAILDVDSFECDGKLEIEDLQKHLDSDIVKDGFETAAGLVLKLSGRIPRAGDHVQYGNYDIEVLEVVKHRITRLRFRRLARASSN